MLGSGARRGSGAWCPRLIWCAAPAAVSGGFLGAAHRCNEKDAYPATQHRPNNVSGFGRTDRAGTDLAVTLEEDDA